MKHDYQELIQRIQVPEDLNDQVLAAARKTGQTERTAAPRRKTRPLFRAAVCAACALALVAGTLRLNHHGQDAPDHVTVTLDYTFGLAAHAAEVPAAANGGVVFGWVEEGGHFRVTGEGFDAITLSTDRGELWRAGACFGSTVTEPFDPAAIYGLVPAAGEAMESLDGASLTLTAHLPGGGEDTRVYRLSTEALRTFRNENGEEVLVPALAGDPAETVPGLYAVAEGEGTWFHWPVEGSNTVSLSNDYGFRVAPGGQGGTFHGGIDIPGKSGMSILAAADGVVTETGFDAERGNYLILDHENGLTTLYGQCREVTAAEGDTVKAGETIAALGSTGMSTGPHLHFEVRQDGEAQNPVAYFDSEIRDTLRMG